MKKAVKAGKLANGWERGKGSIVHYVDSAALAFGTDALCGVRPAIAWSEKENLEVNCRKCIKLKGVNHDSQGN